MREPATFSRRALAAAFPLAALAAAPAAALPAIDSPDADPVIDLGRRWLSALEAEQAHGRAYSSAMCDAETLAHAATGDELHDATSALFDRITGTPATTLQGLAAKARVLAYENDVENLDDASIAEALRGAHYFVDRAALSLAVDILRLARSET